MPLTMPHQLNPNFFCRSRNRLALSVAIIVLLLTTLPRTFYVNDDVGILSFVRSGHPLPLTVNSYIFSSIIAFLYSRISLNTPWYGMFLYLCHVISLYNFFTAIWFYQFKSKLAFCISLIYILFYAQFVTSVTFTSTSILLLGNTLLAVSSMASDKIKFNLSFFAVVMGMLFAYFLRPFGAVSIVVFGIPLLFYGYIKGGLLFLKKTAIIISFVVIFGILDTAIIKYTADENFKNYSYFLRELEDNLSLPAMAKSLSNPEYCQRVGLTPIDVQSFQRYIYLNEKFFHGTITKIVEMCNESGECLVPFSQKLINAFTYFSNILVGGYFLTVPFLILLIFSAQRMKMQLRFYVLLVAFSYSSILYAGIILYNRMPDRVYLPITLVATSFLMPTFEPLLFQRTRFFRTVFFGIIFSFSLYNFVILYFNADSRIAKQHLLYNTISLLSNNYPARLYIIGPLTLNFENMDPLNSIFINFLPAGWTSLSPAYKDALHSIDPNADLNGIKTIASQPNILFLMPSDLGPAFFKPLFAANGFPVEVSHIDYFPERHDLILFSLKGQ